MHKKGATYELSPGFGWSNAVPDGDATANFLLDGAQKVHFTGTGYHDKVCSPHVIPFYSPPLISDRPLQNWGAQPANVTANCYVPDCHTPC